jgi:6-phosphogluconolactonase
LNARVRVFADLDELSRAAAAAVADTINSAVRSDGRCSVALSGGSTPRELYRVLGTAFRDRVAWGGVHVFWGDERLVPAGDPARNDRMAREMLLEHVACPASHIHPMPTNALPPADAAREYDETMRRYFAGGRPRFDLVLLGLGAEGHTASIFPDSPALDEHERWVCAVSVPADPPLRLTLTMPVLSEASNVFFLVSGAGKSRAFRAALDERTNPRTCPAAAVRPINGTLTWWADAGAAESVTMATEKTHDRDNDMRKGAVEGTEHDPIVPVNSIGAVFEDSEVAQADERGHTSDAPREEEETLGERDGRR